MDTDKDTEAFVSLGVRIRIRIRKNKGNLTNKANVPDKVQHSQSKQGNPKQVSITLGIVVCLIKTTIKRVNSPPPSFPTLHTT